jgi:hypothetical protein
VSSSFYLADGGSRFLRNYTYMPYCIASNPRKPFRNIHLTENLISPQNSTRLWIPLAAYWLKIMGSQVLYVPTLRWIELAVSFEWANWNRITELKWNICSQSPVSSAKLAPRRSRWLKQCKPFPLPLFVTPMHLHLWLWHEIVSVTTLIECSSTAHPSASNLV